MEGTIDITPLTSLASYVFLVALVALSRMAELLISHRNQRWLVARGAIETGHGHYPAMVLLHTAFLVSCPLEVWLFERHGQPSLALAMGALLILAMTLRVWVMATLGRRWTTRVLYVPGTPVVSDGPYRFLRHPNYLAVVLEIIALPLLHGAWTTALVFSLANGLLLAVRIPCEAGFVARLSRDDHGASRSSLIPEEP
jgi:methyltransferase